MKRKLISVLLVISMLSSQSLTVFANAGGSEVPQFTDNAKSNPIANVGDSIIYDEFGREWKLSEPILDIKDVVWSTYTEEKNVKAVVVSSSTYVNPPIEHWNVSLAIADSYTNQDSESSHDYGIMPDGIPLGNYVGYIYNTNGIYFYVVGDDHEPQISVNEEVINVDVPQISANEEVINTDKPSTTEVNTGIESASSWAVNSIENAIKKGFVPEELQGNYKNVITREEFCVMAIRFLQSYLGKDIHTIMEEKGVDIDRSAFDDTNNIDVLIAYALGITSGTSEKKFTPNGEFTREQAAAMILNTCRVAGMDVDNVESANFNDMSNVASWAVDGVNFCSTNGIMNGTGNNNFSPKSTYTIEQSIVTFYNIK